jgi:hypothetical protein
MRTKTLLLSALLGAMGSVAVQAQTNVYSLNAVGYITTTLYPGYNLITVPLITAVDTNTGLPNTLETLFNNSTGAYNGDSVYIFANPPGSYTVIAQGKADKWGTGGVDGTNQINPGQAVFYFNHGTTNITNIFVGTVPSGGTNVLVPGYNLVGSMVPTSGDLFSNSISALSNATPNIGDLVYVYDPVLQVYSSIYKAVALAASHNGNSPWQFSAGGDPSITNVGTGFFYFNNSSTSTSINWVENYSVSQ